MDRKDEVVAFDVVTTGLSPFSAVRRKVEGYSNGQPCIAFQLRPDGVEKEMTLWVR